MDNQKYIKIKLNPHRTGCLKPFLTHSRKPTIDINDIKEMKTQKFSKITMQTKGMAITSPVIVRLNKFELYSFTKSSTHCLKAI